MTYVITFDLVASSTSYFFFFAYSFFSISREETQIEHIHRYGVHYIDWLFWTYALSALFFFHKISFSKSNYRFFFQLLSAQSTYWLYGKRISHFWLKYIWKKKLYNFAFSTLLFCVFHVTGGKKNSDWNFNFGNRTILILRKNVDIHTGFSVRYTNEVPS